MSKCVLWDGKLQDGYGHTTRNGRTTSQHRIAYEKHFGPIPKGMCVLHKCDNRACINPNHLWLGTRGDNNRDRAVKGRNADRHGSKHPLAKLNEKDVLKIRVDKRPQKDIAFEYGITQGAVSRIQRRNTWVHI